MSSPAPHPMDAKAPAVDENNRSIAGTVYSEPSSPPDASNDTGTRVETNAEKDSMSEASNELMRVDRTEYHHGTDPHDYENKLAEDRQFEEMAPTARVFKMCLEEYGKLDGDNAANWRDGLDVLIVFAGVFSAVVSTLVSQTSQDLQVDFGEISAHLMTEMVLLQRAAMSNLPASSVPVSDVTLTSALRVSSTGVWVNGLWFTSLALSLAAALIAVLTKQWIHQFLTTTSGSAQDRIQIRQYRYEQLQKWHVPLIIGMLPIFMHISLGAFLAGLVIYVRSLSTPVSLAVGLITFAAFVVYFGTNLHPIFNPASPYKTFLTRYTYHFYRTLCERLASVQPLFPTPDPSTDSSAQPEDDPSRTSDDSSAPTFSSGELSLERVEQRMVTGVAPELDARALSDLYNLSSNTCVKSIILQSFSNMPLQTIPIVAKRIRALDKTLEGHVQSMEYTLPQKRAAFERLFRAHVRIRPINLKLAKPCFFTPDMMSNVSQPTSLSVLLDEDRPTANVVEYLRQEIVRTENCAYHDILSWACILQNALYDGLDWLDVEDYESPVWKTLFGWLVRPHGCHDDTACHNSYVEIMSLPIRANRYHSRLTIREYPGYSTTRGVLLTEVIAWLMRTSIAEHILKASYPDACRHEDFNDLPVDILLNLAILQSPKLFSTSRSSHTYESSGRNVTAMTLLLKCIREYLGVTGENSCVEGGTLRQHSGVVRASFHSLVVAITSSGFTDGSLTSEDTRIMVSALVRTLRIDPGLFSRFSATITSPVFDAIMVAAFEHFPWAIETSTIIVDILRAHVVVDWSHRGDLALDLGVQTYDLLIQNDWLNVLDYNLFDFIDRRKLNVDKKGKMLEHYYLYMLVAVAFVDGLETLSRISSPCHERTCLYLQNRVPALCKLLVLADGTRRDRLWMLPRHVSHEVWLDSISLTREFVVSSFFETLYGAYREAFHAKNFEGYIDYATLDNLLPAILAELDNAYSHAYVPGVTLQRSNSASPIQAQLGLDPESSSHSRGASITQVTSSPRSHTNTLRDLFRKIAYRKGEYTLSRTDSIVLGAV